jgi:PPK2 family polyphosphate:nucleotide phosphotransferase
MPVSEYRVRKNQKIRLRDYDPDDVHLAPDKKKANEQNAAMQKQLAELQELVYAGHQHKVLVLLQGMDASGKDGAIRHVMGGFNPQGVRVVSFGKPNEAELDHDYLWRVHAHMPGKGEVAVFNRSHYEDVLIVRVRELVPKSDWKLRYAQINDFERMLSENGTVILKFFLHISKNEQRKRLEERIEDPTKRWKFQHGDLAERKLWSSYQRAYEDALTQCSTPWAPWHIVPANQKWYRNYVIGSIVIDALKRLKMKFPQPDLSGVVVE